METELKTLEERLDGFRKAMTAGQRSEFDRLTRAQSEVVGNHRRGRIGDCMYRNALQTMIETAGV